MKCRASFTLLEILVVVIIITVLSGLVFKMIQIVQLASEKANTITKIEKVSHALEEFRAEYGQYPPVVKNICQEHSGCSFCYVHENTNLMAAVLAQNIIPQNTNHTEFGKLFQFGVMAYLVERNNNTPGISDSHLHIDTWVGDTSRDEAAKRRWGHFLYDPNIVSSDPGKSNNIEGLTFTNTVVTVKDAWNAPLKYASEPPYLKYDLWSKGKDGIDGTSDDLHNKKWDN
jgi:type II secretory pathway pseudopilin PulG